MASGVKLTAPAEVDAYQAFEYIREDASPCAEEYDRTYSLKTRCSRIS